MKWQKLVYAGTFEEQKEEIPFKDDTGAKTKVSLLCI